jgi:hypothetical protein
VSAADNIRNLKGFKISRNMFGKCTYSEVWYIHLSIDAKKKNVKERISVNGAVLDSEFQNMVYILILETFVYFLWYLRMLCQVIRLYNMRFKDKLSCVF